MGREREAESVNEWDERQWFLLRFRRRAEWNLQRMEQSEARLEEGWWDSFIIYLPLRDFIFSPCSPHAVTLPWEPILALSSSPLRHQQRQKNRNQLLGGLTTQNAAQVPIWRWRPSSFADKVRQRVQGKRVCLLCTPLCSDTAKSHTYGTGQPVGADAKLRLWLLGTKDEIFAR